MTSDLSVSGMTGIMYVFMGLISPAQFIRDVCGDPSRSQLHPGHRHHRSRLDLLLCLVCLLLPSSLPQHTTKKVRIMSTCMLVECEEYEH